MKKKILCLLLVVTMVAACFAGCGKKKTENKNDKPGTTTDQQTDNTGDDTTKPDDGNTVTNPTTPTDPQGGDVNVETKDGYIRSELSNEWIPDSYKDMRPVAMMIPNDKKALPHYNISKASVLYQCQVEGRITRLMALFDTWQDLGDRVGNVRSARTYYVYWALEWDALFVHFGNPYYADGILSQSYTADTDLLVLTKGTEKSGGAQTEGGKNAHYFRSSDRKSPQNAYVSSASLLNAFNNRKYSLTHTDIWYGRHYLFADSLNNLEGKLGAFDCNKIDFAECYPIDKAYLEYDETTGKYLRYEFGAAHVDEATGEQLAFDNVIVQFVKHNVLDKKGYLSFLFKEDCGGYYITQGKAIPISWVKAGDLAITRYYDWEGNEIQLNTGKTMVCIVENDDKTKLVMK